MALLGLVNTFQASCNSSQPAEDKVSAELYNIATLQVIITYLVVCMSLPLCVIPNSNVDRNVVMLVFIAGCL